MASINSLPPEVLSDILTLVATRPAPRRWPKHGVTKNPCTEYYPLLRTLCLVSRLFKAIAQARIFRHIVLRCEIQATLLLSSSAFGQHSVKTLSLAGVDLDTATIIIQRCGSLGLVSLSLEGMGVNARAVLAAGPDLRALEIIDCSSTYQDWTLTSGLGSAPPPYSAGVVEWLRLRGKWLARREYKNVEPAGGWVIPHELERLSIRNLRRESHCIPPSLVLALISSSSNLRELDIPRLATALDLTSHHPIAYTTALLGLAPDALETLALQITSLRISPDAIEDVLPSLSLFANLKHLTIPDEGFGPLLPRVGTMLSAFNASNGPTDTFKLEKLTLGLSCQELFRGSSPLMRLLEADKSCSGVAPPS